MKRYRDIAGDGGSNIAGQVEAQLDRVRLRLAGVRRVVAIVSGKGGVGKSSVAANLAAAFALSNWSVGVLDADLNGPSIAKLLGIRGRALATTAAGVEPPQSSLGVKAMSMDLLLRGDATPLQWTATTQAEAHTWRGTMEANALREFLADTAWGELDLLLIDLPPGTDRLTTITGLLPILHGTVVVTIPSEVAHLIVKKSITVAQGCRAPVLGLIENMAGYACPDCGAVSPLFTGPGGPLLAAEFGIPFLGAIPFDPRLARAGDRGVPFVTTDSSSPAAAVVVEIAASLRRMLDSPSS